MKEIQLDLTLLLPDMQEADQCVSLLIDRIANIRGVEQAHIVQNGQKAQLCIHYDPNLFTLAQIERLAKDAGAAVTTRYRHEQIPFAGLETADSAQVLQGALAARPGMLHTSVSYAAGLIFVAYDTQTLSRATIDATIAQLGAKVVSPSVIPPEAVPAPHTPAAGEEEAEHDHGHDHGSAPTFLPHWMQEKWTLILVGLAGFFWLVGWLGEMFLGLPPQIALMAFLLAYLAGGYDVATHAIPGLLRGKFDTDVLMLAAAAGAALLGEWPEGAFLLFLFSLGHAGEHYALDRARQAVNALGALMPQVALVRRDDRLEDVPVDSIQIGEIVLVRPGDRIPVDGVVHTGESSVDQSPITGESVPVIRQKDDPVFAGTINQSAALEVQVSRRAADNTLSRILKLVQEAQSQQSPTQQATQRFTSWFVPTILIIVVGVIVLPPLAGWIPLQESFYRAMLLLVAASPCALAIGTPAAVLAGIAQAARHGVLIKGGVHLENLGALRIMAFDKTGTLTEGKFQVTDLLPRDGVTAEQLLSVAAAVEQQSNHPLAQAVVQKAEEEATGQPLSLPLAGEVENIAGKGVRSRVQDQPVWIGSLRLFQEGKTPVPDDSLVQTVAQLEAEGKTTMIVSQAERILGVIALADRPRAGVRETLQQLLRLGIVKLVMLTGDNRTVAQRIGTELGVTDIRAELLPEDKLRAIQQLKSEHGAIAMTGDGVNDAPALASSTVGIAMGGAGTAVALETADVALMADDLSKLPFVVGLSRASRAIIQQNLAISLGIILMLLFTSVLGWVELSGAVILHEGSTLVVVFNALRLLAYRPMMPS